MLEQSIRRMVSAERSSHRGNRNARRLAVVPDERHHFLAHVSIKLRLHVAPVKRMRALIVKPRPVHRIHAEKFHAPGVNQRLERRRSFLALSSSHSSPALVGKSHQRRTPVPVHHHAHIPSPAGANTSDDIPFSYCSCAQAARARTRSSASSARYYTAFACAGNGKNPGGNFNSAILNVRCQITIQTSCP